jgi:hypothetical protein
MEKRPANRIAQHKGYMGPAAQDQHCLTRDPPAAQLTAWRRLAQTAHSAQTVPTGTRRRRHGMQWRTATLLPQLAPAHR